MSLRALWMGLIGLLLLGCNADSGSALTPVGGLVPDDPTDPVICVGDPDSTISCTKSSDLWDCTQMPNGDKKCSFKAPVKPDGTSTWQCTLENGKIICTTPTPNVTGASGWTCTTDASGTRCEYTPPKPPSGPTGASNWSCTLDKEFGWSCTGTPTQPPTTPPTNPPVNPPPGSDTICFDVVPGTTAVAPPEGTWAKLTAKKVLFNGTPAVYVKLILSKAYVDNTYGAWAIGYDGATSIGKHHSFGDLLESDKNEFFLADAKGDLLLDFNLDYFSVSSSAPSGYGCLGVTGGEGQMLKGNASDILAAQTSLGTNFNVHGYKLTVDSPKTDLKYTPDPKYPKWIFEVVYEFWAKLSAFGSAGPGKIYITGLHASPNKLNIKPLPLTPGKCPP